MPTFANLVDRVRQEVEGFSQNQQQWTALAANITNSQTSFTVTDVTQVSRGQIEVGGSELMIVANINQSTSTVNLQPFGRGVQSSPASAWPSGTKVENNPLWPSVRIKEAINDAIRSVYPQLWSVGTTSFPKISVVYEYSLPADAEEIISVQNQLIGPSHVWPFCRNWRFVGQASPTDFASGKSLYIADDVVPGRQVFVTYQKEPSELVNDADDFAATTGLPNTAQDVIFYGACMKLIPQLEATRLAISSVEASERAQYVQPGSAGRVSGYYGQLYAQRLEQEAAKLRDRYQRPSHYDF